MERLVNLAFLEPSPTILQKLALTVQVEPFLPKDLRHVHLVLQEHTLLMELLVISVLMGCILSLEQNFACLVPQELSPQMELALLALQELFLLETHLTAVPVSTEHILERMRAPVLHVKEELIQ